MLIRSAGLDNAIWGGTLFATTELNDPTYFSDFNVTLAPGSRDAAAILAGFETGSVEALQVHPGVNITNLQNTLNLDVPTIVKAALATNAPGLLSSWVSNPIWTLEANASSPANSGNQVTSGNIEIYNNVTGDALTHDRRNQWRRNWRCLSAYRHNRINCITYRVAPSRLPMDRTTALSLMKRSTIQAGMCHL